MNKKLTILALFLSIVCGAFAEKAKIKTDISIFGVAISVSDSVVYMTDMQEIGKVTVEKKTKFLVDRREYSNQLSEYISKTGDGRMTTLVSYNLKKKKAEKRYLKIKERFIKDGYVVKYITKEEFAFTPVQEIEEE